MTKTVNELNESRVITYRGRGRKRLINIDKSDINVLCFSAFCGSKRVHYNGDRVRMLACISKRLYATYNSITVTVDDPSAFTGIIFDWAAN